MLASGYVPDEHNATQFRSLALRVAGRGKGSADEAIAELLAFGRREYAPPFDPTPMIQPNTPRKTISLPTVITFRGDVFTVRKQFLLPFRFEKVRSIVEPRNWDKLGSFWEGGVQEDIRDYEFGIREGFAREKFVVDWNTTRFQEFNVLLKFTQRSSPGVLHTDYSLMYEADDQLLVDEGFAEVQRWRSRRGWSLYTGEKTLKFASAILNLLSPGVMAMFLESQASTFEDIFRRRRRRRKGRAATG
jgi:hypothetical protein